MKWSAIACKLALGLPLMLIWQNLSAQNYPEIKSDWRAQWIGPFMPAKSPAANQLDNVHWIWTLGQRNADPAMDAKAQKLYFRKSFNLTTEVKNSMAYVTADNSYRLYINGMMVDSNDNWEEPKAVNVQQYLQTGKNLIAIEAENINRWMELPGKSPAGLLFKLVFIDQDDQVINIESDGSWKISPENLQDWHQPDFDDSNWQAAFVTDLTGLGQWMGEGSHSNSWYCYRKQIELKQKPESALVRIAVDSKYWLWINGEMVVFEGALKRGPNRRDTYYDEIEVAKYLQQGYNQIAILSWYWGRNGFCHYSSGQPGLLFEMNADDELFKSDATWKVIQHPAYGFTGEPHPNYRLPEFNVHYDAGKELKDWQTIGYDDTEWPHASTFGVPPVAPWNQLWKRPFPQWKDSGLLAYENDQSWPTISDGNTVEMQLPRNISITPYLKIEAPAGQLIDIRTDNYAGGSENNIRAEYITREGVQEFECFAYMNGHRVIYSIPQGVKILDLKYRETRFNTEFVGSFQCDDPFLNQLWMKARNTMNINMRDAIQDPDRERSQWWGDAVIVMGEIFYSCDTNAYGLIRKCMSNLVEWQKPDGILYSPIPGKWDAELPLQMLASVGKFGFYRYYRYTGDSAMIQYVYPYVKKYLRLWELGENGLVQHRTGDWDWGDWGDNKDRVLMDNAWYVMALEAAIAMAEMAGDTEDVIRYQQHIQSIKSGFNEICWQGTQYRSPQYQQDTDDRGHGLATLAGLADQSQWQSIREVLQQKFHASPYTEKYVLESFFQQSDADGALDRMKSRYEKMVNHPWCTTLWEGWGIGPEGYGGGSYNHGWAGGPLTLLSEYVAGVAPVEPGYKLFQVMPQLSYLKHVEATIPTLRGLIRVEHQVKDNSYHSTVEVPANAEALIGIPVRESDVSRWLINGKRYKKIQSIQSEDFRYIKSENHYHLFKALPNNWKIEVYYD